MGITKRPPAPKQEHEARAEEKEARFIGGAPDGAAEEKMKKGVIKGKRLQISHTLPYSLLTQVDALAETKGLTRAGLINLAISEFLERTALRNR